MKLLLKHWVKKKLMEMCISLYMKVFFSLLKDEQHLSVNDIGLTNLGQNFKSTKSTVPHKVKPKQREINN